MAQAAGLPMVGEHKNPAKTTTFGVGSLIRDAVEQGCKSIVIGLGGSCTNDAGAGAAAALGTKFYNEKGESFGADRRHARTDRVLRYGRN